MDSVLPAETLEIVTQARDKGASSWLQVLPIQKQGWLIPITRLVDPPSPKFCALCALISRCWFDLLGLTRSAKFSTATRLV